MKKLYMLFFTLLISTLSFGQGTETFDNFPSTSSSYVNGTFDGQDGSTWTYTQCRGDLSITGQSIMLGKDRTPQAEVYSGTIPGGIGTISFNYMQAFSTNVNLNILVNDIVVGNVTSSGEQNATKASGTITVNQPGDVVLKFKNVNNSDGQVVIDDVVWTGYTGAATPTISTSSSVSGMFYYEGNPPSSEKTFTVSGINLTSDVVVTAPTNFEVSLTSGSGFGSSVNLTPTTGTVNPTDVYVRLVSGLSANTYTGDATASSTGASDQTVSLSGLVSPADPLITISGFVSSLEYAVGNGPSSDDSFSVEGIFLTNDITVTAPTNFEVSLTSGSGFGSSVTLTQSGGTVAPTDIYVRLAAGLAENTYSGDVTASSTGATDKTITVSGLVNPAAVCANVGDIIITEIMQNPSAAADADGEYFEVYNTTGSAIDMIGWTISDADSESHTIGSTLVVPANGYAVLGINSDSVTNGGVSVDYQYSGFNLANGADEIIISCSSNVIDQVSYDGGPTFPDPNGASMELSTTAMNSTDNDNGANWGTATSTFGSGDKGTPGAANDFTLSAKQFEANNFKMYPNPTSLGYVKLLSKNNAPMTVSVFDLLGKQVLYKAVKNNTVDVSSLKTGLYLMKVTQDNASITKKLVVQ